MPPFRYVLANPDARLSEDGKKRLIRGLVGTLGSDDNSGSGGGDNSGEGWAGARSYVTGPGARRTRCWSAGIIQLAPWCTPS